MHRRQSYVKEWLPIIDASEGSGLSDVAVRFGRRLREVRQDRGISQEKLAELAGLHRTYVSSVELGKRNISLFNIESLARALRVKMAELMPDWRSAQRSRAEDG
jgi:transcriptional regulator with XRE-family HTH domain